jgi:hypothetical protein
MKTRYFIVFILVCFILIIGCDAEKSITNSQNPKNSTDVSVVKNTIIIPLNYNVKLKFDDKKLSEFSVAEVNKITKPIDMMQAFTGSVEVETSPNIIELEFATADFTGDEVTVLTCIHEFSQPITFKAEIMSKGADSFKNTSIVQKVPGSYSIEQWQTPLKSIKLYDFEFVRN